MLLSLKEELKAEGHAEVKTGVDGDGDGKEEAMLGTKETEEVTRNDKWLDAEGRKECG